MAEEIDFENGRNSNFEGLVTLTFDPAIRHIVLQQSSTSTYIPTFIQIEETFCGRTDVRTDGRTDIFPLYTIRSTFGSRPNNNCKYSCILYHFQVIWRWIIVTLKRSLKVIQTGTIRKLGCGFLFAFHSNYGSILHHLRDRARRWSKIVIISYSLSFSPPFGIFPSRLVWEN